MAFTSVVSAEFSGSAASATLTHGLTINENDTVLLYVNRNATTSTSADAGGSAWTELLNEIPSGKTARQSLFMKTANSSEPASYGVTFADSANYRAIIYVVKSDSVATIGLAAVSAITAAASAGVLEASAIDGRVLPDNSANFVFAGKDDRAGSTNNSFNAADNSFVGAIGGTLQQETGAAYRFIGTGATFSGNVEISGAANSQNSETYSIHLALVETNPVNTLSIDSLSPSTPVAGSPVVINLANAAASGKTVSYNGHSLSIDSEDASSITINSWPYPWDLPTADVDFNTGYTLQVVDASGNDTATVSTSPAAGDEYFTITGEPWGNTSIFFDDPAALTNGDKLWGQQTVGSGLIIATNGTVSSAEDADEFEYRLYDVSSNLWGPVATEVFSVSSSTLPVDIRRAVYNLGLRRSRCI